MPCWWGRKMDCSFLVVFWWFLWHDWRKKEATTDQKILKNWEDLKIWTKWPNVCIQHPSTPASTERCPLLGGSSEDLLTYHPVPAVLLAWSLGDVDTLRVGTGDIPEIWRRSRDARELPQIKSHHFALIEFDRALLKRFNLPPSPQLKHGAHRSQSAEDGSSLHRGRPTPRC